MKEREDILKKTIAQLEERLRNTVEGALRIITVNGKKYYYHRKSPDDYNGVYIPKGNIELVQRLAQKEYDQKALKAAQSELKRTQRYLKKCSEPAIELVYEQLTPDKQQFVKPVFETDDKFVEAWQAIKYQGKRFYDGAPQIFTEKGERVRSKSEMIIADLLLKEGVPYRYEYPITICEAAAGVNSESRVNTTKIYYPDFTVLNVRQRREMYWEHFGMMDDHEYMEKALKKIQIYEQNGIFPGTNLLITYETMQNPLNSNRVLNLIRRYLKQ